MSYGRVTTERRSRRRGVALSEAGIARFASARRRLTGDVRPFVSLEECANRAEVGLRTLTRCLSGIPVDFRSIERIFNGVGLDLRAEDVAQSPLVGKGRLRDMKQYAPPSLTACSPMA